MWTILCLPFLKVGGAVECIVPGSGRSKRSHSCMKCWSSRSFIGVLKSPITKISWLSAILFWISVVRSVKNCLRGLGASSPVARRALHCCCAAVVGPADIADFWHTL